MATITKRGKSYLIRCYAGYSVDGKRITKSMTYRPEPGMTQAKNKKEVQRQTVLFEEFVKAGECDGKRIKFEKFAEQWLKDYAEVELAPKTVYDYRKLLPSINAYIGHASGVLCLYQGRGVAVHRQQSGCPRGPAQKGQSRTARADGGRGSVHVGASRQGTHPLPHGSDGPADDRHAAGGAFGTPLAQSGLRESVDCH